MSQFAFAADASDASVDDAFDVVVQSQDQFGNRVPTENRDVTVAILSGSAVLSSAGLVPISFGQGSVQLSATVPQNVTLGLVDSEGTTLGVTATSIVTFLSGTRLPCSSNGLTYLQVRLFLLASRAMQVAPLMMCSW